MSYAVKHLSEHYDAAAYVVYEHIATEWSMHSPDYDMMGELLNKKSRIDDGTIQGLIFGV